MARIFLLAICLLAFASTTQAQRGIGSGPHSYNVPKANYHIDPIGSKLNAPRMFEPVMTARSGSLGIRNSGSSLLIHGLPGDLTSIQIVDESGRACPVRINGTTADVGSLRPGWYQVRATTRSRQDMVANFHKS